MTAADIPRWMRHDGVPLVAQFLSKGRDSDGPLLWPGGETADGRFIDGTDARELMLAQATLGEAGPYQRTETKLSSYIYQYRRREQAVRAWTFLNEQATTCPSFVKDEGSDFGRAWSAVDTHVSALPSVFGAAGLDNWTDVSCEYSDAAFQLELLGDTHFHYSLAGTSIVQVKHYTADGDSRRIGRATRGFVQTMAIVVAQRVERRSSRKAAEVVLVTLLLGGCLGLNTRRRPDASIARDPREPPSRSGFRASRLR
jgi:hypothetical protein